MANDIRALMNNVKNVRNVCVIGHQNHGKSALASTLYSVAGITPTSSREGEQDCVTITKPTTFSLYCEMAKEKVDNITQETNGNGFLINLVDPPGQIDLQSETTAALCLCDGTLIIVDSVEGVGLQTEIALRQALNDRIQPILFINKMDHAILITQLNQEDLYQSFKRIIDHVNTIISANKDEEVLLGHNNNNKTLVDIQKGSVAFGSGLYGWGFTISLFAERYAKKFGIDSKKMLEKLWGDNYFNPITKQWNKKENNNKKKKEEEGGGGGGMKTDRNPLIRSFNMFILDPIFKIFKTILTGTKKDIQSILEKTQVRLTIEEQSLQGKQLVRVVLNKYLPVNKTLLEMTVIHLPSPITAQKYRVQVLYDGPLDDKCAHGIRTCNPEGPLMIYMSKMVPTSNKDRFYGLGRVFSGTIREGLKIRIQGPTYKPSKTQDLFIKTVEEGGIVHLTGSHLHRIENCSAGNIVGLIGMDQFLIRSGTITTLENAHNLKAAAAIQNSEKSILSSVVVVEMTVDCKVVTDLPKLIQDLKYMSKIHPWVHSYTSETGEHIIGGSCESQIEIYLKQLEEYTQIPIQKSSPYARYRETITAESYATILVKSPNKHNRAYLRATPLGEELSIAIENGQFNTLNEFKTRAGILSNEYGWNVQEARRIWTFGPQHDGANVLVDMTKGVSFLNEIKDSTVAAFQWSTQQSVYTEEPLRACRFNIMDVMLLSDAIHRGGGQFMPMIRKAIHGSTMMAEPRLVQAIYRAEVRFPTSAMGNVYRVFMARGGRIVSEEDEDKVDKVEEEKVYLENYRNTYSKVKAFISVPKSFGLPLDLSIATSYQATTALVFDHWETIPFGMDHPEIQELILGIRKRKGLKVMMPNLNHYMDKL